MRINFTSILMRGCGIIFRCLFLVSEPMRTTINVDEKLLNDLMRLHKSGGKSEAINAAVRQFVRKKGIEHIRSMRGKLEFHPDVLKWRDTVELDRWKYLDELRHGERKDEGHATSDS